MPETFDLEELLKRNPRVNKKQLEELIRLYKKLLESGAQPGGYRLAPPYSGKRVIVGESADDSRTKRLARRVTRI